MYFGPGLPRFGGYSASSIVGQSGRLALPALSPSAVNPVANIDDKSPMSEGITRH